MVEGIIKQEMLAAKMIFKNNAFGAFHIQIITAPCILAQLMILGFLSRSQGIQCSRIHHGELPMRAKMAERGGGHVQQSHYPESWVSVQKREREELDRSRQVAIQDTKG